MQSGPVVSLSPSFNGYASTRLADIAARVIDEFRAESDFEVDDDVFGLETSLNRNPNISQHDLKMKKKNHNEDDDDDDDDFEFEFQFVCRDPDLSPISADEIFYNGQIRPIFPIFNTDLLSGESENQIPVSSKPPIRLPLRKLMFEDRDSPSCSSSEADDLDRIPAGTYCVWTPKATAKAAESPGRCKKSNSTGSSKRWKFRDLLHRSNSDGKDTFVFLTPPNSNSKKRDEKVEKSTSEASKVAGNPQEKSLTAAKSAMMKEGDRRLSFLPYRQDLVGFFANVKGLSRNLHPY